MGDGCAELWGAQGKISSHPPFCTSVRSTADPLNMGLESYSLGKIGEGDRAEHLVCREIGWLQPSLSFVKGEPASAVPGSPVPACIMASYLRGYLNNPLPPF